MYIYGSNERVTIVESTYVLRVHRMIVTSDYWRTLITIF
jgi:hypothetical protein